MDNNYGNMYQEVKDEVSVKEWLITMLIMSIPIVNFVMTFVWAFGSNTKPSKANFFKASILMAVITIAVIIVLSLMFGWSLGGLSEVTENI